MFTGLETFTDDEVLAAAAFCSNPIATELCRRLTRHLYPSKPTNTIAERAALRGAGVNPCPNPITVEEDHY